MIGSGYERRSETTGATTTRRRRAVTRLRDGQGAGDRERDLVSKIARWGSKSRITCRTSSADVDRIRRALDRERQESLVEERLSDTVIRRRSKSAPPLPPKLPLPPPRRRRARDQLLYSHRSQRIVVEPRPRPLVQRRPRRPRRCPARGSSRRPRPPPR